MSRTTETINFDMYQGQFPIWDASREVPRDAMVLIGAPDTDDCGDPQYVYYNLPMGRVLPISPVNLNRFSFESDLEIPVGQVVAVYILRDGFGIGRVTLAQPTSGKFARMIAVGADLSKPGNILLQNTGFCYLQNGHEYSDLIGQKYYLGEDGVPTTDPVSGQELFTVVDSTTLAINIQVI